MDSWEKLLAGVAALLSGGAGGIATVLRKMSTSLAVAKTRLDDMERRMASLENRVENPGPSAHDGILKEIKRDIGNLERKVSDLDSKNEDVWRNLVPRKELTSKLDKLIERVGTIMGKLEALSGRI